MSDTTFTFGQRGSHFFQCPATKEFARLPPKLASLLCSPHLKQVYHVALGFEDSFLLTWRDKRNQTRIDSRNLPSELNHFLFAQNEQRKLTRNIPNIRCSLGPYNASFFAHDGEAYSWMNLPTELLTALQSRITNGEWTDRPRLVGLGANSNFILITEDQSAIWNLASYQNMDKSLQRLLQLENGVADVRDIALHGYRYNCFVVISHNGTTIFDGLPPHMLSGMEIISNMISRDSKAIRLSLNTRKESNFPELLPRQNSNLQKRAQLRRQWSEHSQEFTAQTRGVKLSLSLSVSAAGLMKVFK